MAQDTKIEWCDHTVNFWWGCSKVSPACAHCYAERKDLQFHASLPWRERFQDEKATARHWGPDAPRLLRVDAARREALRYEKRAAAEGRRFRVFTNSMSDFFEDRRDLDLPRLEALDVIRQTPHLDWLILTKRPERIVDLLRKAAWAINLREGDRTALYRWITRWVTGDHPANVWLGTTVEDQPRADQRIPDLRNVPAAVKFLSVEPMLGPIDLDLPRCETHGRDELSKDGTFCNECAADGWSGELSFGHWLDPLNGGIGWVICGGESGPHARPMHPDWARSLRDQCAAAGVPYLHKQNGEWILSPDGVCRPGCDLRLFPGLGTFDRVGKKAAGRLLDGVEHNGYPEVG